jgi:V/A-type H+/Na+-transporting ATPase subunit C
MFTAMLELARASRIRFLVDLEQRVIDVANVKVLMRACVARWTPESAEHMLIDGGVFDATALAASVRKSPADLASDILATGVVRADTSSLADMTRLDVVLDQAVAHLTHEARMVATGPEPVLAYVLARQEEAVSLRALLVGKLVGLDRETVHARLREAI